jgi:acyl-CoA thioester hydrolase
MIWSGSVNDEWIDALGHMNMRYYVHVFTDAADSQFHDLFFSTAAIAAQRSSVTAELHLTYAKEAKARQAFQVVTWIAAIGSKSLHLYQEMRAADAGDLHATAEQLWLNVDLTAGRTVKIPESILCHLQEMQAAGLPLPADAKLNRAIKMRDQLALV